MKIPVSICICRPVISGRSRPLCSLSDPSTTEFHSPPPPKIVGYCMRLVVLQQHKRLLSKSLTWHRIPCFFLLVFLLIIIAVEPLSASNRGILLYREQAFPTCRAAVTLLPGSSTACCGKKSPGNAELQVTAEPHQGKNHRLLLQQPPQPLPMRERAMARVRQEDRQQGETVNGQHHAKAGRQCCWRKP